MRSFRHWTARYIFDRLMDLLYQKRHPDHPRLTPMAISILPTWLQPTDVGFEWGSGRSTLWFAKRVQYLTSVEHDPEWYERITKSIAVAKLSNIDLQLQSVDGGEESPYVHAIDGVLPDSLDFVLIDGRLRHWCVKAALPKLKPGGLLILDNANRYLPNRSRSPGALRGEVASEWKQVISELGSCRSIWTSNGVSDTAIFLKPI